MNTPPDNDPTATSRCEKCGGIIISRLCSCGTPHPDFQPHIQPNQPAKPRVFSEELERLHLDIEAALHNPPITLERFASDYEGAAAALARCAQLRILLARCVQAQGNTRLRDTLVLHSHSPRQIAHDEAAKIGGQFSSTLNTPAEDALGRELGKLAIEARSFSEA